MKSRGIKKQSSKLISCILRAPIMVLRKARDFYVENLIGCTGGGGGGIFSASSEKRRSDGDGDDDEDLTVLLRAAFAELDVNRNVIVRKKGVDRSYSDRVGRIGRIDENEACDFMEVDESNYVYPRCRSYAAVMKNLGL